MAVSQILGWLCLYCLGGGVCIKSEAVFALSRRRCLGNGGDGGGVKWVMVGC